MISNRFAAVSLVLAGFSVAPALAGSPVTTNDRVALQAAMFQYIDQQVVNGEYLNIDLSTGKVEQLAPSKAHPMLVRIDDKFVLCTDFFDKAGKPINVDFYTARRGNSFVVFHTEINNRDPLKKLMRENVAAMVE